MFLWFVIKLYKRNDYFSMNLTKCQKWITQRNDLIWCDVVHSIGGTLSGEIKYVLWINRIISHHWQNVHWVFFGWSVSGSTGPTSLTQCGFKRKFIIYRYFFPFGYYARCLCFYREKKLCFRMSSLIIRKYKLG